MDFDLEVTRVLVILHVQLLPFCEMYEDLYFGSSQLLISTKHLEKQGFYTKFCLFSHCTLGFPPNNLLLHLHNMSLFNVLLI